jgi:tyrosyl-tRNA synthetase
MEALSDGVNAMNLDAKERFSLIAENLAEILDGDIIEKVLAEGRNPRVYWGRRSF